MLAQELRVRDLWIVWDRHFGSISLLCRLHGTRCSHNFKFDHASIFKIGYTVCTITHRPRGHIC